jgi:hypothetical protein
VTPTVFHHDQGAPDPEFIGRLPVIPVLQVEVALGGRLRVRVTASDRTVFESRPRHVPPWTRRGPVLDGRGTLNSRSPGRAPMLGLDPAAQRLKASLAFSAACLVSAAALSARPSASSRSLSVTFPVASLAFPFRPSATLPGLVGRAHPYLLRAVSAPGPMGARPDGARPTSGTDPGERKTSGSDTAASTAASRRARGGLPARRR